MCAGHHQLLPALGAAVKDELENKRGQTVRRGMGYYTGGIAVWVKVAYHVVGWSELEWGPK